VVLNVYQGKQQLENELDVLKQNFSQLETKYQERGQKLNTVLFKSSKFKDLFGIVNENLLNIESQFESLSKNLIGLENIYIINEQIKKCSEIQTELLKSAQNIEELKELSEKLIDNCDTNDDRDRIEKRLDLIINKWNLLSKQIDDKFNCFKYLNLNLKQLKLNYTQLSTFLNDLDLNFKTSFSLNCIQPIVIKHQYENMRERNDAIMGNFQLLKDTKELCLNLIGDDESDDLNLASTLDRLDLETKLNEIDSKYSEKKCLY
jgi:hypothetical protein